MLNYLDQSARALEAVEMIAGILTLWIYYTEHSIIGNKMKSGTVAINDVLEEVEHLDMNNQEYIVDILSKRLIESRRAEIAIRVKEAVVAYKEGKVKSGSLYDLWKDLND